MRFDAFGTGGPATAAKEARTAEAIGFDAFWAGEVGHDPLLSAGAAIGVTDELLVGTGVLIAFARTPMTTAQAAWDLAASSNGRFILGLGTQVKAHVTRRYGMPWSDPAARMRDFIAATRAILHSYQSGDRLDYAGPYYQHSLLTPFFNPGPIDHPNVEIALAAVGEHMTELAGEVCDGLFLHPFTNVAYMDKVTLPSLERGATRADRTGRPWILGYALCVVGDTEEEQEHSASRVRQQIAFYASTPTYRDVLDAVGHGDLQGELHALVSQGAWHRLADVITDDVLNHFAARGTLEELPDQIRHRFLGRCHRVAAYFPLPTDDPDRLRSFLEATRAEG